MERTEHERPQNMQNQRSANLRTERAGVLARVSRTRATKRWGLLNIHQVDEDGKRTITARFRKIGGRADGLDYRLSTKHSRQCLSLRPHYRATQDSVHFSDHPPPVLCSIEPFPCYPFGQRKAEGNSNSKSSKRTGPERRCSSRLVTANAFRPSPPSSSSWRQVCRHLDRVPVTQTREGLGIGSTR